MTDIHEPHQAAIVADVADILQIPALLCRQTDLLVAAGKAGKAVNIKKGQFVASGAMKAAADKVLSTGNNRIILTERGTTFGYEDLIVDMRNIARMKKTGFPVVFDGTHSVQKPSSLGDRSGGEREFVAMLCRSAIAAGTDALFLEVHPAPDKALSDGPNMIPLPELGTLLEEFGELYNFFQKMK